MAADDTYPPIDPTTFDLIVIGTGLPESIISAAAAAAGKTVLHLDPNPFYGSHYSSLSPNHLLSFLNSNTQNPTNTRSINSPDQSPSSSLIELNLTTRPLYTVIDSLSSSQQIDSKNLSLDLNGPRVLFCADYSVDLLIKSSANQYMEFKNIEGSLISDNENGALRNVPDSKSAIFKDKSLGLIEKRMLYDFLKLVQHHLGAVDAKSERIIEDEDLETPFSVFLTKMRLPHNIKSIILYAIAMADYDQDNAQVCKVPLKTKDGINRLALYHSSIGRFPNAQGALIYPIYGQGELPQAFCRRAAVKGCIYVLRMPVIALLVDKETESYKGVKLASGQQLFSEKLILDPSFTIPSSMANYCSDYLGDSSPDSGLRDVKAKVARGICITNSPLKPDLSSCLVFFPPTSLYPGQVASVRVLQLASSLAVCPSGMFVFYISALCEDANEGEKLLKAAVNSLFSIPISGSDGNTTTEQSEISEDVKPTLLWSVLYIQELTTGSFGSVSSMPMPDVNLNYSDTLHATAKLFQKMYPGEEFFPVTTSSDNPEE